jgi:signal transduction histidine kinase
MSVAYKSEILKPVDLSKHYLAKIVNLPVAKKELKESSCILPISVGQAVHEYEKFSATLQTVNHYFKKCYIIVGDTLQRHTMSIYSDGLTGADLYNEAKQLGDEWLCRNLPMIQRELKIPYEISRWDEWLAYGRFKENHKIITELYQNDPEYQNVIHDSARAFWNRAKSRDANLNKEVVYDRSISYLLEECACIPQWVDLNAQYNIYSNLPRSIHVSVETLEPEKSKSLLYQLRLKFILSNINKLAIDEIFKMLPGHVYWKDTQGIILGANLQQAQAFGFNTIDDLIGKNGFDLLDRKDAASIQENDIKVMNGNKVFISEECVDGRVYISYKSPLKDTADKPIGIIGVSLDIHDQKVAEKKLEEANQNLLRAIEIKKLFLNNVSHEIRTPLSNILKISQLLYEDWEKYPNNEARKSHLALAVEASNRLESVLTNLLDLSSFESGKLQYKKKLYSLKDSVKNVINEFINNKHRIRFVVNEAIDFSFVFDHFRIEQVIRNLLANALKYDPSGEIVMELKKDNQHVYFFIKDEGIGVPENEVHKIFEIFIQGTRTIGSGGTGSGLSIAKTIIEDHNGRIWAESGEHGVGSIFAFQLPLNEEESETVSTYL